MSESSNAKPKVSPTEPGYTAPSETLEARQVNALLLSRGWGCAEVDARAGWTPGVFKQHRSHNFPGSSRPRIERVFGVRLFADERTWLLREACFRRYGFDPALLNKIELRAWIKKLDLTHRVPGEPNAEQLLAVLLNHLSTKAPR